jgi:hypothetical protein
LIIGSLTPSVIGDRPSHPIYRDFTTVINCGRILGAAGDAQTSD